MAFVTGGGVGLLPGAPGTWGSAAALIVLLIPVDHRPWVLLPLIILVFLLSIPSIRRVEERCGPDPGFIVIDEILGMWVALLWPDVYNGAIWLILLFCFYRIFDIFKIWPLNLLNARHGAIYVLVDDIAAGLMAAFTISILKIGAQIALFAIFGLSL